MSCPKKTLEMLEDCGAELLRQRGTHQVWKLPNGKRVTISVSRKAKSSLDKYQCSIIRRMLRHG